jgi:cytoskeletal protein RodZ
MQVVGERLRQTRIEKGLSLEQASMTTRIKKAYLEAIERGDREALPSPVQGRGFLRLYAGFLGLPSDEIVADWEGRPRPVTSAQSAPSTLPSPKASPQPDISAQEAGFELLTPTQPTEEYRDQPQDADASQAVLPAPDDTYSLDEPSDPPAPVSEPPAGSQAILVEIGAQLRRQRERLGISVADIEKHTHIRHRYIQALEAGRHDLLPSPVQSRGMLSNYAVFLNLDAEIILLRFADALQARRLERLPSDQPTKRFLSTKNRTSQGAQPTGTLRRFLTTDLLFGSVVIIVFFIFIVWTISRLNLTSSPSGQATLPSVSEMLLSTAPPTAGTESARTSLASTNSPSEAGTAQPEAPQPPSPLPATSEQPAPTLGPINSDPIQLYIIARQRTFLRVTVDGQIRFNGRLVPGNAYPYSGKDRIDILLGDITAVQIFYNQNQVAFEGEAGQSAIFSFTQAGIITPTPIPTLTPSQTPNITATPTPGTPLVSPTITPLVP